MLDVQSVSHSITPLLHFFLHATTPFLFPLHQLQLTGLPRLVDPGLQRSVSAKDDEPALARNGLDPVGFLALGRLGPK